ncbi:MAG: glycyl-tRNA synthetase beta chain [Patescibacteria group bacterium]|nr:glycyl-tRNA synthetase beta chain [Patescibacteria group bacterium]
MISFFVLRGNDRDELAKIIAPFVAHERFAGLRKHRHHLFFNRYEHLIHTASLCYRFAKLVGADTETCVLAGLLHDFHETRVKGYEHGLEAARNAVSVGLENALALDIIRAHMFPLGFGKVKMPRSREFAVLKAADVLAAVVEVAYGSFHSIAAMSLEHSRVRFAETRDILVRIAAEIERSVETAICPPKTRET